MNIVMAVSMGQMADKLGHIIRMESELGKGTKVWIGFDLDYADTRD